MTNETKKNNTIWVFPKIGGFPQKWMVKMMEKPIDPWMIWEENPLFLETSIYDCSHPFPEFSGMSGFGLSNCFLFFLETLSGINHQRGLTGNFIGKMRWKVVGQHGISWNQIFLVGGFKPFETCQIGSFSQVGVKTKHTRNHHLVFVPFFFLLLISPHTQWVGCISPPWQMKI